MELGQRIRAARLEQGLSQRQLCGEVITRNMLSQIESGSARPSMATLSYLASRLGRPVSYFLEEDTVTSPNQACMARAREAFAAGDAGAAVQALENFHQPDESFTQERNLLLYLALTDMARTAVQEQRLPYALSLLDRAAALEGIYITQALREQAQVLALMAGRAGTLPDIDGILLLRAARALDAEDGRRAAVLLDSAEDRESCRWRLLRGRAAVLQGEYAQAVRWLQPVQEASPREVYPLLEVCFRELGDFKSAYDYACRQRAYPQYDSGGE